MKRKSWEIEVTHRELKNNLGISRAQVVNKVSVKRCPQVVALANSIVHLAHLLLDEKDESNYLPPPKWDKNRKMKIRLNVLYNFDIFSFFTSLHQIAQHQMPAGI